MIDATDIYPGIYIESRDYTQDYREYVSERDFDIASQQYVNFFVSSECLYPCSTLMTVMTEYVAYLLQQYPILSRFLFAPLFSLFYCCLTPIILLIDLLWTSFNSVFCLSWCTFASILTCGDYKRRCVTCSCFLGSITVIQRLILYSCYGPYAIVKNFKQTKTNDAKKDENFNEINDSKFSCLENIQHAFIIYPLTCCLYWYSMFRNPQNTGYLMELQLQLQKERSFNRLIQV